MSACQIVSLSIIMLAKSKGLQWTKHTAVQNFEGGNVLGKVLLERRK
jgi:hypothetical protein